MFLSLDSPDRNFVVLHCFVQRGRADFEFCRDLSDFLMSCEPPLDFLARRPLRMIRWRERRGRGWRQPALTDPAVPGPSISEIALERRGQFAHAALRTVLVAQAANDAFELAHIVRPIVTRQMRD